MKCANVALSVVPRIGAGDPSIEIEFEFDIFISLGFIFQHIARPVESYRPINTVFVRSSVRSSVVSL